MTITHSSTKEKPETIIQSLKACLVTDQLALSKTLQSHWDYGNLQIMGSLADLIDDRDCSLYIIDTAIRDMHIWPAPLLTNPDADSRLWLFLVSKLADHNHLEYLPAKTKFFDRDALKVNDLIDFVKKQLDPQSARKIEELQYLENIKSFVIHMENGKTYILRLSDLSEADSSKVTRWTLAPDHSHFRIVQKSGNCFEVPWDNVLYNCEPAYEYYKGKAPLNTDQDYVKGIGQKIRQLRLVKGYTIEALAQKAGLKRPNLSRLENGKHQPSLETLEHITAALGVTVAEVLAK